MKCQSIPGVGRVPMTLANSERLRMLVIQGSKVQLGTNKCLPAFRLVACFGIAEEWARCNLKRGRSPVGRDRTRLAASFHAGQRTHSDPVSADAECSALPTARIISMLASPWEGSNRDLIQFGPLHSWMRRGRGRGKPGAGRSSAAKMQRRQRSRRRGHANKVSQQLSFTDVGRQLARTIVIPKDQGRSWCSASDLLDRSERAKNRAWDGKIRSPDDWVWL